MMGPTHALGGAAALAAVAIVTNTVEYVPMWAYGVAAASALIPDADNDRGSLLNRPYLMPLKLLTLPLWMNAPHRGRTHSLLGTAGYVLIALFWTLVINFGLSALDPTIPAINLVFVAMAAGVGYFSHLVLDLFNLPGELLLWPLPARIYFPPVRRLRFATGTWREHFLVNLPMTLFAGWFIFSSWRLVAVATNNDGLLTGLPGAIMRAIWQLLRG